MAKFISRTLRRHTLRLLLRQQGRCGVTLSDCCCGSRDVAASHSHTAVAAAETLRRHSGKLLLRQQGRCQWWLLRISSCGDRSAALAMKLHRFEEVPDIASVFGGSQVVFAYAVVNPPLFQRGGCLRRVIALHIGPWVASLSTSRSTPHRGGARTSEPDLLVLSRELRWKVALFSNCK